MENRIEKYTDVLGQMIRFETISTEKDNDLAKFREFHKLLKKLFPHVFNQCEVEDFNGSLLIHWKGKDGKRAVCFMNHHDVVEANGDWKVPPFSAEIVDGKMYGRGTLDTKGGLFAMLSAADELIEQGFVPEVDVYFESACNEEVTGAGCKEIAQVLKERGIRFDYLMDEGGMIVDEPLSGVKGYYAMIGLGERGRGALKFIAKSRGGHASTPDKDSPLARLGKFMAYVDEHDVFEVQISDVIVEMLKSFAPNLDGAMSFVYGHADLFRPILKKVMPTTSPTAKAMTQTTLAFTMAKGADQSNVLPQTAYIIGDMRTSNHQGYQSSLKAITEVAKKFDIEVEVLEAAVDSNMADLKGYGFTLAKECVKEVFEDVSVAPYIMNQCSDARFMSIICDNCLRFSPLVINNQQMKTIHGIDENVDIKNLDKAVDFYKAMIQKTK